MEDIQIIELYWQKNENAIYETDKKYGKYCSYIAYNILKNKEDSKECVNDTYLKVWNVIPPEKPNVLKAFLGKITRNLAINKYEKIRAKKRNKSIEIVLEELEECIPDNGKVEETIEYSELVKNINLFLENLSEEKRKIFIYRYWYLSSIKEISIKSKIKENNVKVILHRLRIELKNYLTERGVNL